VLSSIKYQGPRAKVKAKGRRSTEEKSKWHLPTPFSGHLPDYSSLSFFFSFGAPWCYVAFCFLEFLGFHADVPTYPLFLIFFLRFSGLILENFVWCFWACNAKPIADSP
jgi:hypothetical protein